MKITKESTEVTTPQFTQMTAPAKPTIDEQIEFAKSCTAELDDLRFDAILAALEAHKRITEAAEAQVDFKLYPQRAIDALQSALRRVCAERDAKDRLISDYEEWLSVQGKNAAEATERAETAERQLAELREKHERLVARLREPTMEMRRVGWNHKMNNPHEPWDETFKAMSAVALRREGE